VSLLDKAIWHGKAFSGGWTQTRGGESAVTEPATGAELGRVGRATPADIAAAATVAAQAQQARAATPYTKRAATGIVHINDQTVDDSPSTPFGGIRASGTGARFGGSANIEAFTETR
jgi:acyl-CoA reductase-like NAD-dependent aldehyde dehydrogenase